MLSEVPKGWRFLKLGDVTDIKTGGTPSRKEDSFWGGDIPWMSSGEVWKKRVFDTEEKITEAALSASAAKILPKGSVMIALNGQGRTRGAAAILERDMTCNQSLAAVVPSAMHDNYFMLYFIESQYQNLRNITGDNARNGLNLGLLKSYELAVPPLNEQHRIAETLSSVDASIKATQAVIEQAERVRRGMMGELLTGGLGSEAIERGEVPGGWTLSKVGELTELQNGYGFKSKDWAQAGLPIIRIQNLNGGGDFNYFNGEYDNKYLVNKGDLLFCWSGSRGTSFGARYWTQEQGLLNQHIFKCVPKEGVAKSFLYFLLDWMTVAIEQKAHGGAGLAHIKKSEMIGFSCVLPPITEQRRISEILSTVDDLIAKQRAIVEQQIHAKNGLMDDLLTGNVRTA